MILDLSNVKIYFQFVQMIMCLCFVQKKTRFSADDDPKQFKWIQLLVIIFLCIVQSVSFTEGDDLLIKHRRTNTSAQDFFEIEKKKLIE